MILTSCILFPLLFLAAETAVTLEQDQLTVTKSKSKTARIRCKVFGTDATSATIHWYQQKDGEALKRILYIAGAAPTKDPDFISSTFSADKNSKESNLIIQNVQQESHSATYYCAYWDSHMATMTLEQKSSLTRKRDRTALITCTASNVPSSSAYIHWYQKKDGEAFKRILYLKLDGTGVTQDLTYGSKDFQAEKRGSDVYILKITSVKDIHSATYYCAYWDIHSDTDASGSPYRNPQ
ncbi:uncharacterized protein LOC136711947 [Amia ocellicauda]|uniref:uncharacterized protein LOC136711947 n=1 Tax=Amia ocellicauda TaxID=2972642 RepID=UPI0034638A02